MTSVDEGEVTSTQSGLFKRTDEWGVCSWKTGHWSWIKYMPLNIHDQLKAKCGLELRPCSDVNIVDYNKQPIECIGKRIVKCQHGNIVKQTTFYMTSVSESKVHPGTQILQNIQSGVSELWWQVSMQTNQYLDVINELPRGLEIPVSTNGNVKKMRAPTSQHQHKALKQWHESPHHGASSQDMIWWNWYN